MLWLARRRCSTRTQGLAAACALVLSCSGVEDNAETEPSAPGVIQPEDGGDAIGEAAACERLAEAQSDALDRLDCEDVQPVDCPSYVRPAGSLACRLFSEDSVDACVDVIDGYERCEDFATSACVVTALDETDEQCEAAEE